MGHRTGAAQTTWITSGKYSMLPGSNFTMTLLWSYLPTRYGDALIIGTVYRYYQNTGLFARLRSGLKDNPDAANLVTWLDRAIKDTPKKHKRRRADWVAL